MSDFSIPLSKWQGITEAEALDSDWDIVPALTAYQQTLDFCQSLERRRLDVERLISRHLGIPRSGFTLLDPSRWVWGSFNICLPIDIHQAARESILPAQAILRIALPFRSGEDRYPGNVDEKLRCEAATYIWLQRHCPSIPIPRLLAIGFPGTQSLTAVRNESLWKRLVWRIRSGLAWIRGETIAPFSVHHRDNTLSDLGYLLLEYVVAGRPLSSTWKQHLQSDSRRMNLYRDLSNILLDLAGVPLPRIGSWTMDGRGVISLTNRPLLDLTMLWGRHGFPTRLPGNPTYTSSDTFVQDLLAYHDDRIRHQANAILSRSDGIYQLSALTALRALLPTFWDVRSRDGPFVLNLPDLHQSNMFVDEDWNIVGLIDFEFAPVAPVQMVHVPLWLSDKSVDELTGSALDEYQTQHDRFLEVLEEQERTLQRGHALSRQLRENWDTGRTLYNAALGGSNAFPIVFEQSIQPRFFDKFDAEKDGTALMRLWAPGAEEFVASKLRDKAEYDERIRAIFAAARARAGQG